MSIVFVTGSPSIHSRSTLLLGEAQRRIAAQGIKTRWVSVRELNPTAILQGNSEDPSISAAIEQVTNARAVVLASPIYKAAYSGLLKLFLDVLPQTAFENKPVLVVSTAGSPLHAVALDFTLRPVLVALRAREVLQTVGAVETQVVAVPGGVSLDAAIDRQLNNSIQELLESLKLRESLPTRLAA